jgi:putative CocE/NonD family hydrolase
MDQQTSGTKAVAFGSYVGAAPRYRGTTTQSTYIPMRDGVRLAVEVILPRNLPSEVKIPALLSQTRYWREMELRAPFKWFLQPSALNPDFRGFRPFVTSRGYALVDVDVRGTGASFGTWLGPWTPDSVEDAGEVIDWIVAQPWCDGRVGTHGISYLGTTAELAAVLGHPAVLAAMPMFNHPDPYTDIAFPGGILNRRFIESWGTMDEVLDRNEVPAEFGFWGRLLVRGVKPVGGESGRELLQAAVKEHQANGRVGAMAHEVECRDDTPGGQEFCLDGIAVHHYKGELAASRAVLCGWGSWMDAGTADAAIRRFLTFDNTRCAVIGAWDHGGRFNASPYRTADRPPSPPLRGQWAEMLRFFDAYLKDEDNGVRGERALYYYTMGEERWKKTPVWPPEGTSMECWYLGDERALLPQMPRDEAGSDSYAVNYQASSGLHNRWWELSAVENKSVTYGDRAAAGRRLLTYTSPPLRDAIEISGYPVLTLYLASTASDVAVYAYLEDVDEQGRVTYVTEGQLRPIHRRLPSEASPYDLQVPYHSFRRGELQPLTPGEVVELAFGLHPTSVLIRRGHRLRLGIAGHDEGTFPRVPPQGTPVLTLERNAGRASRLELPTLHRA